VFSIHIVRVSLDYEVYFTQLAEIFKTMLILQVPELVKCSQVINGDDVLLIPLMLILSDVQLGDQLFDGVFDELLG
jgi:hypothetical protein